MYFMAKKFLINGCIGCGICTSICPELFELNEHREAINTYGEDSEIPEDLESTILEAIDSCPVNAISLYE